MLFRVLSPKQGIQFHYLERVSFWTRSLKKSMKVGNEWSTSVVPTIFFSTKSKNLLLGDNPGELKLQFVMHKLKFHTTVIKSP